MKQLSFYLLLLLLSSCYSENKEDLFGGGVYSDCDTNYVNYNPVIKSMFDNKCISCHQQEWVPGCNLDSFPAIMLYIENKGELLYTTVKNNDHQGVFLTPCEIKQFSKWMKNPAE